MKSPGSIKKNRGKRTKTASERVRSVYNIERVTLRSDVCHAEKGSFVKDTGPRSNEERTQQDGEEEVCNLIKRSGGRRG